MRWVRAGTRRVYDSIGTKARQLYRGVGEMENRPGGAGARSSFSGSPREGEKFAASYRPAERFGRFFLNNCILNVD